MVSLQLANEHHVNWEVELLLVTFGNLMGHLAHTKDYYLTLTYQPLACLSG